MPDTGPEAFRFRLDDHQRRLDEMFRELDRHRDRLHALANQCQQIPDHQRRIDDLEALKLEVLVADVKHLERRLDTMTEAMATKSDLRSLQRTVDTMSRALWTAAGSLLLAAVVFALSVASGQI